MKIRQATLKKILQLRAAIESEQQDLDRLEAAVKEAIQGGAAVAKGSFRAEVRTWERRSPAWREIVERELGVEYAERVLAHTKPTPQSKLIVEVAGC